MKLFQVPEQQVFNIAANDVNPANIVGLTNDAENAANYVLDSNMEFGSKPTDPQFA